MYRTIVVIAVTIGVVAGSWTTPASAQPSTANAVTVLGSDDSATADGFYSSEFSLDRLPNDGWVRFGYRLRDSGGAAVVANARVDRSGNLEVQLWDLDGNVRQTVRTGMKIKSSRRVHLEAEILGSSDAATIKLRIWNYGSERPAWQLAATDIATGHVRGSTTRVAWQPEEAQTVGVSSSNYWTQSLPSLLTRDDTWQLVRDGDITPRRHLTFFAVGGECSVDGSAWSSCGMNGSEVRLTDLDYGPHTVTVRNESAPSLESSVTVHVRPTETGVVKPTHATAGVPSDLGLVPMDGSEDGSDDGILHINTDRNPEWTQLDGRDIRARVVVQRGDVSITRSTITAPGAPPHGDRPVVWLNPNNRYNAHLRIADSTVQWADTLSYDNVHTANTIGVKGENISAERIHVRNVSDGINIDGDDFSVVNSVIDEGFHSLANSSDKVAHDDAVQVARGNGTVIAGNTMEGYASAAIMVTAFDEPITSLSIEDNWLDGGTCSLNVNARNSHISGLVVKDNFFGMNQAPMKNLATGKYGSSCADHDGRHGIFGKLERGTLSPDYEVSGNKEISDSGQVGKTAYIRDYVNGGIAE